MPKNTPALRVSVRIPKALHERLRRTVQHVRRHGSQSLPPLVRPLVEANGATIATMLDAGLTLIERATSTAAKGQSDG